MQRWQYLFVETRVTGEIYLNSLQYQQVLVEHGSTIFMVFDDLGRQGWELVSSNTIFAEYSGYWATQYCFKHPI